jgi:DUF1680 family protein
LFCSLGGYPFLFKKDGHRIVLAIVLYMNCTAEMEIDGNQFKVIVETDWPTAGTVKVRFENAQDVDIELRLRVPGWAKVFQFAIH